MNRAPAAGQDRVTVVIPTHNRAGVVGQTIESILSQAGVSVDVVVVDDASTDETQSVLARYPTVKVICNAQPTEQRKLACVDELLVAQRQWAHSYSHMDLGAQSRAFDAVVQRYTGAHVKFGRAGHFEVRRRLAGERRTSLLKDLPRILREAPDD